jgi:hypothetical protein
MLVGGAGALDTSGSRVDVPAVGPKTESFEAVMNALVLSKGPVDAANTVTRDSMAMMGWLDRLPFGGKRGRGSTSGEPLDEIVRGAARALKDSVNDSPEVQEALDRFIRDLLRGETESEFSSLRGPVGHMASNVEHAVARFGKMTGNYVANHAQEIGLSAGAAAVAGGIAADAVGVVGALGAVAAF